jgi:hypothetical protein
MLLYSWKKILRKSGGSSKRILTILKAMIQRDLPRHVYDPVYKYYYTDFSGNSFLVNPYALLENRYKWRDKEIADYIGLASFRSTGDYMASGKITLDLAHSPLGQDAINNNRLLRTVRNEIHFLYEDYTGEIKWQV